MSIKTDLEDLTDERKEQTNFRMRLIRLIFKADHFSQSRLWLGFPNTVHAVLHYKKTGEILDLPDY